MKTTIEIADSLMHAARALAAKRRTTLRALVETALRRLLDEDEQAAGFVLRDASFSGNGLQPAFQGADWERIRAAAHEGHGE